MYEIHHKLIDIRETSIGRTFKLTRRVRFKRSSPKVPHKLFVTADS